MVEELNNDNFESRIKGKKVLLDFWAGWCGPCKMLGPVFEEVSKGYKGKLEFFKVNVEDSAEIAERFAVRGIPCLVLLEDGEEKGRIVGFYPKDKLKEKIDEILK